jgi:hypothetical protein
MKYIFVLLYLFINVGLCVSQTPQGYDLQQNISNAGQGDAFGTNTIRPLKPRYEGVVGTTFFSEKPINGSILMVDGKRYTGFFNFDWMENTPLFYKKETSSYMIIDQTIVKQLNLDFAHDSLITLDKLKNNEGNHFFGELLGSVDGAKIYLNIQKTMKKADYTGAYSAGKKYDEILNEYKYFVYQSESCKLFKPTKKVIAQMFPSYSEKISKNSFLLKPSKPDFIGYFLKLITSP